MTIGGIDGKNRDSRCHIGNYMAWAKASQSHAQHDLRQCECMLSNS